MCHRYTPEQIEFIREVSQGRYNDEIAALFNDKYGTTLSASTIKSTKANYCIKSNVPRKRKTKVEELFTEEQKAFIKENLKGLSSQKLADLVNLKFGLSITKKQIKTWKKNRKLDSGLKGSEGMDPSNKGTKGVYNVGGNRTSFKKGQKPKNYKPVGSERIDTDGYVIVKISDIGPRPKRWRHKHKLIWEELHGPIPKGHCLIFLDGNSQNITLENLQLVSRSQLARLNQNHLISDNPEATKTGIIIADIYRKIGERKKAK